MGWTDVLAAGVIIGFGIPLARTDLREHRLPDRLTLPLFVALLLIFGSATLTSGNIPQLLTAVAGSSAMALLYALLAMLPRGMGWGDAKLALSLGLCTAWWSWECWLLSLFAAFFIGGMWALAEWANGRSLRSDIAFGPAMLLGWSVAAIAALP